ncbi:hypothetical protein M378DRAFT_276377 [Amanita muscaria Koide BX008]|uniref:Uncharacterized protein n=1 Tax=Amanita muscaria (strain Koide BX008) TaxID=946122 RepID=A0A0C2SYE3_AMAMK|nr:hypothetical protein M378DRAFT_276377 [Amanita muscaria Koide BX008]
MRLFEVIPFATGSTDNEYTAQCPTHSHKCLPSTFEPFINLTNHQQRASGNFTTICGPLRACWENIPIPTAMLVDNPLIFSVLYTIR